MARSRIHDKWYQVQAIIHKTLRSHDQQSKPQVMWVSLVCQ